jgi:hypothetical protein
MDRKPPSPPSDVAIRIYAVGSEGCPSSNDAAGVVDALNTDCRRKEPQAWVPAVGEAELEPVRAQELEPVRAQRVLQAWVPASAQAWVPVLAQGLALVRARESVWVPVRELPKGPQALGPPLMESRELLRAVRPHLHWVPVPVPPLRWVPAR